MGGIPWTKEEDQLLRKCIEQYGEGKWHRVPLLAGLNRCRKSCRLRWLNYLRPNIKRGSFEEEEVDLIIKLHRLLGNRWSLVAARLPGRTGNDVKNYWNCHLSKKLKAQETEDKNSYASRHVQVMSPQVSISASTSSKRPYSTSHAEASPSNNNNICQPARVRRLQKEGSSSNSTLSSMPTPTPMLCINEDGQNNQIYQTDKINIHDFAMDLPCEQVKEYDHQADDDDDDDQINNKWDWDDSILDDMVLWTDS